MRAVLGMGCPDSGLGLVGRIGLVWLRTRRQLKPLPPIAYWCRQIILTVPNDDGAGLAWRNWIGSVIQAFGDLMKSHRLSCLNG